MKFEVDERLVEPVIRDQIAAAIVSQLGDPAEVMQKAIALALRQKVNSEGKISQYNSENRFDFVEAIATKAIRESAQQAIIEIVEKQKPMIQKAIEDHLIKSSRKTAASIVGAFMEAASKKYSILTEFTFKERT